LVNNLIGLVFGYGWEAVNLFVLLSGIGLALGYRPEQAGFSLGAWYRRRFARILLPYYAVAFPLILAAEALKWAGDGRGGLLGTLAGKLATKNLPDPLWIELAKHLFLLDPRQDFWVCDFFSPAWWFLPPILVSYLAFPLLHAARRRLGMWPLLALAALLSVLGYRLTQDGLWEHGPYFVVLHESWNFCLGLCIGAELRTQAGRATWQARLAAPWSLALGAALYVAGNLLSWFHPTHVLASPVFTAGLGLLLGAAAVRLARLAPVRRLVDLADAYHIYLLHQWLAFPLVALTVMLAGTQARAYGFSLGLLVYVAMVLAVVLGFERIWARPPKQQPPRTPTPEEPNREDSALAGMRGRSLGSRANYPA
jgi:peptidoglycan/LPS O-acetylase OafA/YrhL